MTIYGYMRVSTDDQTTDLQKNALIARGIAPENIFTDTISSKVTARPGLSKLLNLLVEGDVFVVWKLDRLGRSLSHLIFLVDEFNKQKVSFVSLTENIDTTTPSGKLMFHIIGAFAQMEREVISERTKEGMKAAKARGKRAGRPPMDEKKRAEILELAKDYNNSIRDIAKKTKTHFLAVQRVVKPLVHELGRAGRGNPNLSRNRKDISIALKKAASPPSGDFI